VTWGCDPELPKAAGLSPAYRASTVCFFDGASVCDLLLEGATIVRAAEEVLPTMISGFPHGFRGISQKTAMKLRNVLSSFVQAGSGEVNHQQTECSVETRQAVAVDSRGRRIVRKSLVINGAVLCSEEHVI